MAEDELLKQIAIEVELTLLGEVDDREVASCCREAYRLLAYVVQPTLPPLTPAEDTAFHPSSSASHSFQSFVFESFP